MALAQQENKEVLNSQPTMLSPVEIDALVATRGRGRHFAGWMLVAIVMVLLLALLSVGWGRYGIPLSDVTDCLAGWVFGGLDGVDLSVQSVVLDVRLPRVAAAMLVGASLAVAGASYQGVFRNPMVSSDILGASAGAGFGASIAILMGASGFVVQIVAFAFGLGAVSLTYAISSAIGRDRAATLILILAGMVVQAMFQAFIGCVKYVADPYSQLPQITLWLMGSVGPVGADDLLVALLPCAVGMAVLMALRWRVNVLSFGEEEASALGVNTKRLRLVIIACATLVTSASVSIAGQVGWIGLVVPHLVRMLCGPNYKRLIPASIVFGAGFLLVVDNVARIAMQSEIPLGILTAIIGAPIFVFLLIKGKDGWM